MFNHSHEFVVVCCVIDEPIIAFRRNVFCPLDVEKQVCIITEGFLLVLDSVIMMMMMMMMIDVCAKNYRHCHHQFIIIWNHIPTPTGASSAGPAGNCGTTGAKISFCHGTILSQVHVWRFFVHKNGENCCLKSILQLKFTKMLLPLGPHPGSRW